MRFGYISKNTATDFGYVTDGGHRSVFVTVGEDACQLSSLWMHRRILRESIVGPEE